MFVWCADTVRYGAMSNETPLVTACLAEFGCGQNFRLNRANTGGIRGTGVRFGTKGQPDLVGVLGNPVMCQHCGQEARPLAGRYIGIECKRPGGHVTPSGRRSRAGETSEAQDNFHTMIKRHGGLVCVVRSLDEAREWMRGIGAEW